MPALRLSSEHPRIRTPASLDSVSVQNCRVKPELTGVDIQKVTNSNKPLLASRDCVFPHGHLAVGYLMVSGVIRVTSGKPPDRKMVVLVVLGTQLPDLIDKPLAVLLGGAVATGRTVGHSVLVSVPVLLCLAFIFRDERRRLVHMAVFAIGYLVHPFVDASIFLVQGTVTQDIIEISFVVWPVILPADGIVEFLSQFSTVERLITVKPRWTAKHLPSGGHIRPYVRASELVLILLATITWLDDNAPGLDAVKRI